MNCLIVDDESISRTMLRRQLDFDAELLLVAECDNAYDAYQHILNQEIDLVFLDIEMPGMSGMELAKILKSKQPLIIFTTSNSGYAAEAFDLNVVDFLLKPFPLVRFLKATNKAKEIMRSTLTTSYQNANFVFIRVSNITYRLKIEDINYLESTGDYVKIITNDKEYSIYSSLKIIEQKLPSETFLRVHRSFIVNVNKIDKIQGKTLIINHVLIPISDSYKTDLNKKLFFW